MGGVDRVVVLRVGSEESTAARIGLNVTRRIETSLGGHGHYVSLGV